MKVSKFRFLVLLIVTVLVIDVVAFILLPKIGSTKEIQYSEDVILSDDEMIALNLINDYRKSLNLSELKPAKELQQVAEAKAKDLVESENFSHKSEKYGYVFDMLENNGCEYKIAGENLAGNISSEKAVEAWMNSKDHYENLVCEKYNYTGLCVVESPIYGKVFVQVFVGI